MLVLKRLYLFPIFMVLWLLSGLLICFLVALSNGHVSAYVPFISEAGGKLPESGIFGIFLSFGAILGFVTMIIRYFVIFKLNSEFSKMIQILNIMALIVGFISLCGMIIVGAYSMYGVLNAHLMGARILFYGGIVYGFLQMLISYLLRHHLYRFVIFHVRLAICFLSLLSLIGMIIMFPMGISQWDQKYPPAEKVPGDKGFALILASAACEWWMVISFLFFFLSFAEEFKMFTGKISIFQLDQGNSLSESTRLVS